MQALKGAWILVPETGIEPVRPLSSKRRILRLTHPRKT